MNNEDTIRGEANLERATRLLDVCRLARREIYAAQERLQSARGWGMWDMIGGKFFTNVIKHHRIDQATTHLDRASSALRQLSRELKQVAIHADLGPDIGGFAVFADFFFDDIFSALYVQGKIRDLQQQLQSTLHSLSRVETALGKVQAYESTNRLHE